MLNYSKIFIKLKEPQNPPEIEHGALLLNPSHTGGIIFFDQVAEKEFLSNYEVDVGNKSNILKRPDEATAKVPVKAMMELRTQVARLETEPYRVETMISKGKLRAMIGSTLFEWEAETGEVEAASCFGVRYTLQFLSPLKRGIGDIEISLCEESRIGISTKESVLLLAPAINHDEERFFERKEPYIENGNAFYKCDICGEVFWSAHSRCLKCDSKIGVRNGNRVEYNKVRYGASFERGAKVYI